MLKRPLVPVAVCIFLISLIIVKYFPGFIYPAVSLKEGENCTMTGKVTKIEEKEYSTCIYLKSGRFNYLIKCSGADVRIGNTVTVACTFDPFDTARNFGNFDEEVYYRSLGIYQKFELKNILANDNHVNLYMDFLFRLRKLMTGSLEKTLGNDDSTGVITAMVTGDKSGLESSVRDLYASCGISHILAISGLHISFIGMGIYRMLRKRLGFNAAAAFAALAVISYMLMSGASASGIRAVIMLLVRLLSIKLGRHYDMISSMSLAAILLLTANPFYCQNSGFLLSFTAIIGVSVTNTLFTDFIFPKDKDKKAGKAGKVMIRAARALTASFSISITTLPVVLMLYYEFPLYGIFINFIIIPLITYILAGAVFGSLIGIIWPAAGRLLLGGPVYLVRLIGWICLKTEKLPGAKVTAGCPSGSKIVIYYMALAAVLIVFKIAAARRKKDGGWKGRLALTALAGAAMIFFSLFRADTGLRVVFIDVDQGECICIRAESGIVYLIDSGSTTVNNVYENRVEDALKYLGISRIDIVMITHPDTDHVSGIIEALEGKTDIGEILIPECDGNENYENIKALALANEIELSDLYSGIRIEDGSLSLICIHPDKGSAAADSNDAGAVISLEYGEFSALFTGDISSTEEEKLCQIIEGPYDILDVSHHGSKYSSCEAFLSGVLPQTAIISAGVDNSYGHPHKETLERLEKTGAEIFCTADFGEVIIEADISGAFRTRTKLLP